jgi:hypothetical protein
MGPIEPTLPPVMLPPVVPPLATITLAVIDG